MAGLSDTISLDTIIAIMGIVVGITIFVMQERTNRKVNAIIKTQFQRKEREKKYFGGRLMANLELVKKSHTKLVLYLKEYLSDRSTVNKNRVKNFSQFQITHLDEFVVPSMRADLGRLIEFVDDPELVEQLSAAFDDVSSIFKDCSLDSTFDKPDGAEGDLITLASERLNTIDSLLAKFSKEVSATIE
jgi:hypothetical protein